MRKLNRKVLLTASAVSAVSLLLAGCMGGGSSTGAWKTGPDIGGGVIYTFDGDKTGPYYINDEAHNMSLNNGREPTKAELDAWDTDIMAGYVYQTDTTVRPMPEGSGSVSEGEELYEAQCVMCHGDFGSGGGGYPALSKGHAVNMQKTLKNNRWDDPDADGPVRVFGSYWPQANTMWWYIRDGMPHPKSKTLSADQTYALTAYMLYLNEMSIDGELVDEDYVLDREKFVKIKMPNEDGFVPNIKGPNALADVRKFYNENQHENFAAQMVPKDGPCMENCQDATAEVVRIDGGITEFNPPLSAERSLPAQKAAVNPKEVYVNSCAMCHDSYLAPGSAEWAGYTAKGMDKVYENAINGTEGGMPAMGGSSLSKEDFKTVVDYIISGK